MKIYVVYNDGNDEVGTDFGGAFTTEAAAQKHIDEHFPIASIKELELRHVDCDCWGCKVQREANEEIVLNARVDFDNTQSLIDFWARKE